MNDRFTNLMIKAEDIGLDLEPLPYDGYLLIDTEGRVNHYTNIGEVEVALQEAEALLLNYADEWDRNLHRIRPV